MADIITIDEARGIVGSKMRTLEVRIDAGLQAIQAVSQRLEQVIQVFGAQAMINVEAFKRLGVDVAALETEMRAAAQAAQTNAAEQPEPSTEEKPPVGPVA